MPFIVYILYSAVTNRYYVGSTGDLLEERVRRHNSNHDGFTGRAHDWTLVYKEEFADKTKALKREKEIKGWNIGLKKPAMQKKTVPRYLLYPFF